MGKQLLENSDLRLRFPLLQEANLALMDRIVRAGVDPKVAQRFVAKVDLSAPSGCWLWTAAKRSGTGHPVFSVGKLSTSANRWLYVWLVGPIPAGHDLDHLCRNPPCVNPEHMEAVSHQENLQRGVFTRSLLDTCKNGHEWTRDNTRIYRNKARDGRPYKQCNACCRDRQAKRRSQ